MRAIPVHARARKEEEKKGRVTCRKSNLNRHHIPFRSVSRLSPAAELDIKDDDPSSSVSGSCGCPQSDPSSVVAATVVAIGSVMGRGGEDCEDPQ